MAKKRRRKIYEPLVPPVRTGTLRNSITYQAPLTAEFEATWDSTDDYRRLMEMLEPPMTEAEWLACGNPAMMLSWMRHPRGPFLRVSTNDPRQPNVDASDRKLRLFAVACCRQVWDGIEPCPGNRAGPCCQTGWCAVCHGAGKIGGMTDHDRHAVEVAERYADGEATEEERRQDHGDWRPPYDRFVLACTSPEIGEGCAWALRGNEVEVQPAQADLLRCLFGNPFRPVVWRGCPRCDWSGKLYNERLPRGWQYCPHCKRPDGLDMAIRTPTVVNVAQAIYDTRRFEDMPVLADALEESGCTEVAILGHCRGPGPHARGCWVLDLLLGKE